MQKQFTFIFVSLFCVSLSVFANEPQNLYFHHQELIQYHDSGEYRKDFGKVVAEAKKYLSQRLQEKNTCEKKYAIVLDIDDTAISGYGFEVTLKFGGSPQDIAKAQQLGNLPVIPEVLDLYNFAKQNHVAVIFLTGRVESMAKFTEDNLHKAGYNNWDGIYFRSTLDKTLHSASVIPFKAKTREKIEAQGYDILFTMGDQRSDLMGGHADRVFKLPNPFYYVP
jgi:predicted secreted acid phosphatase